MTELFAALEGTEIVSGQIAFPYLGIWHADVLLARPAVIADGPVTLVLAGLTLKGTRIGGNGIYSGTARYRVIGGAGGWRKTIGPQSYQHDAGVRKSLVLGDAARLAGEKVKIATDAALGTAWVRTEGPAVRTLSLVGDPWWIDNDGVTQVGPRPTAAIGSHFDLQSAQLVIGQVTVATDHPEDWVPGRTFSATTLSERTISSLYHRIEKGSLRTEVWIQ